ncbi:MAG: NADP-dependent oxidoreductase [Chloroflexi bacterium]|nr:NADP-dependent oxidoreductase [Chloroflexota bacterium]
MKAVQINKYGHDDVLEVADIPRPTPGPGQVLVKIHAAGVNYYDIKIREGWLQGFFPLKLPHTIGNDFAGEVVELGDGASKFEVGDKVYGLITVHHGGTYAEYLAVDENIIRPMPENTSYLEAASLPMPGLSGLLAMYDLAGIKEGQRLLYHGGAGGVGTVSIQLAKHLGAHVIATCSEANFDFVKGLGADEVLDYNTTDFRDVASAIDVAVDPIGGDTNLRTFEVMNPGGVIIVVLRDDPVEMANRERLCREHQVEVKVLAFDLYPEGLDTLRNKVEEGIIKPVVEHVYPLDQAQEAHKLIQGRHFAGRIVLEV